MALEAVRGGSLFLLVQGGRLRRRLTPALGLTKMPCLHFVPSLTSVWEGAVSFLNSSFISAFLSALAGAGLGVWGAQKLTERSTRARELLDSFRQANAIIVLATTISNQALSIKKQHIKPLSDRYFEDRKSAKVNRPGF
jgi:ABC-type siderophore export system fused ATPase/permease subunit